MYEMPWRFLRAFSRRSLAKKADVRVEGLEFVPRDGPVILAARHVHHQMDGEVLLATIPRPIHLMVAIDWATNPVARTILARACDWARWPTVIRRDSPFPGKQSERHQQNYQALRMALNLLREGRLVVIFPEGFPNIDNNPTPKNSDDDFLPFQNGFAKLAKLAGRDGQPVPIVPVGFIYERGERWQITVRFGQQTTSSPWNDLLVSQAVERQVQELSATNGARNS